MKREASSGNIPTSKKPLWETPGDEMGHSRERRAFHIRYSDESPKPVFDNENIRFDQ